MQVDGHDEVGGRELLPEAATAGLPDRAARVAVRLAELGLTTFEYRSLYRYHRLTRATEDALLEVLGGPQD